MSNKVPIYKFIDRPYTNLPIQQLNTNFSDGYRIVRYHNGQVQRKYYFAVPNPSIETELYEWRNLTNKPIVKIQHLKLNQNTNTNVIEGVLYTQHLHTTLYDINNLNLQQAIFFLNNCLQGFQAIFRLLGYVSINPGNIGFNHQNKCKVWINQNFSLNSSHENRITQQSQIVYQILRIIRKSTSPKFEFLFIMIQKKIDLIDKRPTFSGIQKYINDYVSQNRINIPQQISRRIQKYQSRTFRRTSVREPVNSNSRDIKNIDSNLKRSQIIRIQRNSNQKLPPRSDRKGSLVQSNLSNHIYNRVPKFLFKNKKTNTNNLFESKYKNRGPSQLSHKNSQKQITMFAEDAKKQRQKTESQREKIMLKKQNKSMKFLLTEIRQTNADMLEQQLKLKKNTKFQNHKNTNINFSHQFSINIINQSHANQYDYNQQFVKENDLSNLQTNFGSTLCKNSECKQNKGFDRDFNKKYKAFCSNLQDKMKQSKNDINSFERLMTDLQSPQKFKKSLYFQQSKGIDKQNICDQIKLQQLLKLSNSKRGGKYKRQDEELCEQMKLKEQQIIHANRWKKKICNLLGNQEMQNHMNYSIHYGQDYYNSPRLRLQKLDNIGRSIKQSSIPYSD